MPVLSAQFQPAPATIDAEHARFSICGIGPRINCVVDGDTFWYRGEKIRIADINTPEIGQPNCAAEKYLGERAKRRLHQLLNAGRFSLQSIDRNRDRYGRLLRIVTQRGKSVGNALVQEDLAHKWRGRRERWC